MKHLRGLSVFFLLLFALPTFAAFDAFLKIDGVKGESTNSTHQGWIDAASFSWGMSTAPATTAVPVSQSCTTHEIRFNARGAAAPALLKLSTQGTPLAPVALDVNGQRHVLDGAMLACQQMMSPNGQPGANCVMKFQRCSTHATAATNASMLVPAVQKLAIGGQGSDATIIAVHPGGANSVTLKLRGGSSLARSCATGQHIKEVKLTCRKAGKDQQEYMTFTLNDVLVSSYQAMGDGSVQIGMRYASHEGIVPELQ